MQEIRKQIQFFIISNSTIQLTLTVKTQLAPPNTIDSRSPGFFFSPAVARMVGDAAGDVAVRGRKLLFIVQKRYPRQRRQEE